MSRRNAAEKRPVLPDPQFNNRLATMMVARLMKHGKKSTAQRILSQAFGLINERTGGDPIELFETAIKNELPILIHVRDAFDETYKIINEYKSELKTVLIHCFTGDDNYAEKRCRSISVCL